MSNTTISYNVGQNISRLSLSARTTRLSSGIKHGLVICACIISVNLSAHDKNERFDANSGKVIQSQFLSHFDITQTSQGGLKLVDSNRIIQPRLPVTRFLASGDHGPFAGGSIKNPSGTSESASCMVDFSDFDALNLLGWAPEGFFPYAKDTFTWSPWWHQACTAVKYAVVRPVNEIHFHLGFENPDIKPCPGGPSFTEHYIVHDDGTCEDFDPREKPRSLLPHDQNEIIRVYVHEGDGPIAFGLNSIRVKGNNEIDLCYKPTGQWEAGLPVEDPTQGPWFCWEGLYNGVWDFSAHITEAVEIRINAHQNQGIFKVDDIELNVY